MVQSRPSCQKQFSMVSVAQLVEPRIVIPVVVGSSPIVHPKSIEAGLWKVGLFCVCAFSFPRFWGGLSRNSLS